MAAGPSRSRCPSDGRATTTGGRSTSWSRPPSCGFPASATWPAGPLPLLRRAADRRRAGPGPAAGPRRAGPALDRTPRPRAAQIDAMVASGEPILGVFAERHHPVMLEVLTRRYYRIRPLRNVQVTERSGRPLLTAEYTHDGHEYLIVATVADGADERGRRPTCRELIRRDPGRPDRARRPVRHLPDGRGGRQRRPRRPRRPDPRQAGPHPAGCRPGRGRRAQAGRRRGRLAGLVHLPRRAGRAGRRGPDPARLHPLVAERLGLWRFSASSS